MNVIEFTVPGQPVPKGRPRFARRGKNVVAYTPEKTASYENLVKMMATLAMAGRAPTDKPVHLSVDLILQIPASWSNKRHAQAVSGAIRSTKKPDLDNMVKILCDGGNGVLWHDDAQVVQITMRKDYGQIPRAMVTVTELDGEAA